MKMVMIRTTTTMTATSSDDHDDDVDGTFDSHPLSAQDKEHQHLAVQRHRKGGPATAGGLSW